MKLDRVKVISQMAKNNLTCKDLVKKTGLSRITVTNVRKGGSCARSTAYAIASAIGVDISEIMESNSIWDETHNANATHD